ncbi:inter-alpha-trypsin inhibitor heavy chain H4 [Halyomorpha halys]|uniref:inter-alpha-trypsin inhibitor heavy chain H4 n=1 Tax=Halyomorpha halys TaxID=286706 RepID=UPI0006D4CAAA|nr:inter-alpha-trypsin inhibitor heavy chain H4-like [Halyomorpha halys]
MRKEAFMFLTVFSLAFGHEFIIRRERRDLSEEKRDPVHSDLPHPEVYLLHVESSIKFRYAHTRVTSRIANPANTSQEVVFMMLLPETAFITSFVMEVEGKQYRAYVREKEIAKKEYEEAVSSGLAAAHVHASARNSNRFLISVNVEKSSKALFVLTYEELLTRTLGLYNHIINLNPGQVVRDLQVDVFIAEPTDIIELHVPKIRSSNEVTNEPEEENKLVEIRRPTPQKAHIRYKPSPEEQAKNLSGQLIIKYDVQRTSDQGGQILVNDGYFVHFFAPEGLPPLRKLAVFVLDLSGSMEGRKVEQLKTAMGTILDDLGPRDHFNIIDFSYSVTVHNLDSATGSVVLPPDTAIGKRTEIPPPYPTSEEYIGKAKQVISKMSSGGGTNIYDALKNAIIVAQSGVEKIRKEETEAEDTLEPIIIFLTDGDPTVGITKHSKILTMVKEYNNPRCSIFSLGFGAGADMRFLRKLSLGNAGFARSIYEASDAALQLSNFYKEVASPLLSNVTFTYLPGQVLPGSITKDRFPSLFLGSELVVAGKLAGSNDVQTKVEGTTVNGTTLFQGQAMKGIPDDISTIEYAETNKTTSELEEELKSDGGKKKKKKILMTSLERVWAYLSIQQYVDKLEAVEGNPDLEKEIQKQAVNLALKYKFVTPFTSLVVVKPNKTEELSNNKVKPGDMGFKNKIAYLQGSIHGFPGAYGPSRVDVMATQPMVPNYSTTTIDRIDAEETSEEEAYHSSTEEDYATYSPSRLYLEDIIWLKDVYSWENSTISIEKNNKSETYHFLNTTTGKEEPGGKCMLNDGIEGLCRHVTDCILPQFASSLQEYASNYFCVIEKSYAGACCPELTDSSLSLYSTTEIFEPDYATTPLIIPAAT